MTAGRELDALIAEKIFGLEIAHREWPCGRDPECGVYEAAISDQDEYQASWFAERGPIYKVHDPDGWDVEPHELGLWCRPVPFYSRDIADAWLVVERITRIPQSLEEADRAANTRFAYWWKTADLWAYTSQEAALAICRAALEAVGE